MNLPHPKPVVLAPVIGSLPVAEQIEQALEVFRNREHKQLHERLEALEARWHEKLAKWLRRAVR